MTPSKSVQFSLQVAHEGGIAIAQKHTANEDQMKFWGVKNSALLCLETADICEPRADARSKFDKTQRRRGLTSFSICQKAIGFDKL
jgi:hypothetical protein